MQAINIRSFKQKLRHNKSRFKRFLTRIEKDPPRKLDAMAAAADKIVWTQTDCLTCANCCKKMTPTYTKKDIKRISAYLNMTTTAFTEKWLIYEKKDKDWINKKQPCQFLDMQTNMCSIYEVRPASCAGFPHLTRKKMTDYIHVHKQNLDYCPATYKMVETMMYMVK